MQKSLLNNLHNDIYCRIKASKTHGVGVFAIKDIPKGTNPFKVTGAECVNQKVINVPKNKIDKLPKEVKKMVQDFYHCEDGEYGIPYRGLNSNDISYYMNSSKKPNVGNKDVKGCNMTVFYTLRKIKKGEELLINYDDF